MRFEKGWACLRTPVSPTEERSTEFCYHSPLIDSLFLPGLRVQNILKLTINVLLHYPDR